MDNTDKVTEIWNVWTPFVFKMRERLTLKKNLKKKRWRETSLSWLLTHLQHQVSQLHTAVYNGDRKDIVLGKAADVANVAMMVADRNTRGVE
jgi:hypothetical protein